jgi:hypothetical protein
MHNRKFSSIWGNINPPSPSYLGKTSGNITNTIALAALVVFFTSTMFPTAPNPTLSAMNWSCLALGTRILVAVFSYIWLKKGYLESEYTVENVELSEKYLGIDSKATHSENVTVSKDLD